MRNLVARIITAVLLLPLVLAAIIMGGPYLATLLGLVSVLSCIEVASIIYPKNKRALIIGLIFWAALFFPSIAHVPLATTVGFLTPAFFIFNAIVLFVGSIDYREFEKLCGVIYWVAYITLALVTVYWLVSLPSLLDPRVGLSFIMLGCLATWSNDTFAYFGGRLFGKRPLFKSVSGKKTWEGFFSGALCSIVVIFLLKYAPSLMNADWFVGITVIDLLFIVLPSIALAPIGDLIESRLKRLYDTKDSSKLLPGHGGFLDRIDGLLVVLPWTALYAFIIRPLW